MKSEFTTPDPIRKIDLLLFTFKVTKRFTISFLIFFFNLLFFYFNNMDLLFEFGFSVVLYMSERDSNFRLS